MEILLAGFAAQSRLAVRAMDGLGTEILGAIEGDQHMIAKATEARQTRGVRFEPLDNRIKSYADPKLMQRLCDEDRSFAAEMATAVAASISGPRPGCRLSPISSRSCRRVSLTHVLDQPVTGPGFSSRRSSARTSILAARAKSAWCSIVRWAAARRAGFAPV
jgi:hypothetical protein